MYDTAKKSRAANKAKAERLAKRPIERVDSSDWTPPPLLNADVKTGMRPVSKQALKRGGKVHGDKTKARADRVARKAGGKVEVKGEQPLVDRYINRDLKKANEYRDGIKHDGGLKHGGRAHKNNGGGMTMEEMIKKNPAPKKKSEFKTPNPVPLPPRRQEEKPKFKSKYDLTTQGMKSGGSAKLAKATKNARAKKMDGGPMMGKDPRLDIVKSKAMEFGQNLVTPGLKKGGRIKKQIGGALGRAAGALGRGMGMAAQGASMRPQMPQAAQQPPIGTNPAMMGRGPAPQAMANAQGRPFQMGGRFAPPPPPSFPLPPMAGTASPLTQTGAMSNLAGMQPYAAPLPSMTDFNQQLAGRTPITSGPLPSEQSQPGLASNLAGMAPNQAPTQMLTPEQMTAANQTMSSLGGMSFPMATTPTADQISALPFGPMTYATGGRIARAEGGRAKGKGKTNINIVIAQAPKEDAGQSAVPPMPPAPPPMAPPMGAPMGGPMGAPPMPPPPMGAPRPTPFKKGGRVTNVAKSYKDMTAGAGSGEGRLQKTDIAKRAPHKAGGKVYRSYKDMDAGAGSGLGRLEKTEIQSKKSRKG